MRSSQMECTASVTCADLEYPFELNREVDGNKLVDTLLDLCSAALQVNISSWLTDSATSSMVAGWAHLIGDQECLSYFGPIVWEHEEIFIIFLQSSAEAGHVVAGQI